MSDWIQLLIIASPVLVLGGGACWWALHVTNKGIEQQRQRQRRHQHKL